MTWTAEMHRRYRARLAAELETIRAAREPWQFTPTPWAAPGESDRSAAIAEIESAWFGDYRTTT